MEAQQQSWRQPRALVTILLVVSFYALFRSIYNIYFHPLSRIPGPRAWAASMLPFIRSLLKGTIVHDTQRLHRRHGPILRIAPDEVLIAQPEAWEGIFHSPQGQLLKDPWWRHTPGSPMSLISTIEPKEHARIRKALAPGFSQ